MLECSDSDSAKMQPKVNSRRHPPHPPCCRHHHPPPAPPCHYHRHPPPCHCHCHPPPCHYHRRPPPCHHHCHHHQPRSRSAITMGVLSSHSPNASSDEGEQISFFANCIREQMYSEYFSLQILNILNIIHSLRDLTFLKSTPPRICQEGCSNWRKPCQSTKKEDPIKLLFCSRAFLETLSEILGHQHHVHEPLTSLSLG